MVHWVRGARSALLYIVLFTILPMAAGAQENGTPPAPEITMAIAAGLQTKGDRYIIEVEGQTDLPDRAIVLCRLSRRLYGLKGDSLEPERTKKALVRNHAFAVEFDNFESELLLGSFQVEARFDPLEAQYQEIGQLFAGHAQPVSTSYDFFAGRVEDLVRLAEQETEEVEKRYEILRASVEKFATIAGLSRNSPGMADWVANRVSFVETVEEMMLRCDAAETERFYRQSYASFFAIAKDLEFAEGYQVALGAADHNYEVETRPADIESLRKQVQRTRQTIANEFYLAFLATFEGVHFQAKWAFDQRARGFLGLSDWKSMRESWANACTAVGTASKKIAHADIKPLVEARWKGFTDLIPPLQKIAERYFADWGDTTASPQRSQERDAIEEQYQRAVSEFRAGLAE